MRSLLISVSCVGLLVSCSSSSATPDAAPCAADPSNPNMDLGSGADPAGGSFTMAQALVDLPDGPGPLRTIITTDLGTLTCTLRDDKAPNAVANFIGLARGKRPWLSPTTNTWQLHRFYDGLIFHRVVPDFVIQGGDPTGTGSYTPGYMFADEISDLTHVPGTLAYANSGANTNGSQYYVTQNTQSTLDGGYTIFGLCTPTSVVSAIAHVATDSNEKPLTPVHMQSVVITRCAP